jgi:hypothetical protein
MSRNFGEGIEQLFRLRSEAALSAMVRHTVAFSDGAAIAGRFLAGEAALAERARERKIQLQRRIRELCQKLANDRLEQIAAAGQIQTLETIA